MKYHCCVCKEIFRPEEAVDGYAEGYREGFLCPRCGANIKEDPLESHELGSLARSWPFLVAICAGLGALIVSDWRSFTPVFGIPFGWSTLFFVLMIVLVVIVYRSNPEAFHDPICSTYPAKGRAGKLD